MSEVPLDFDGDEISPQRLLDVYLNTGDYDDGLGGWVSYDGGYLQYEDAETNEIWRWKLTLDD